MSFSWEDTFEPQSANSSSIEDILCDPLLGGELGTG